MWLVKTMNEDETKALSDKKKVLKAGWITALGIIMILTITLSTLIANGITSMNVHVGIMMILIFVYPVLFFFLGVWVVMKKKLFPFIKE